MYYRILESCGGVEILIINDGSTDDTWNKLLNWQAKYPSLIKVLNKDNGGQSSARNLGLDIARGQKITFVDSDDYVHPEYLETLYSRMCESGAQICMCATNRVAGDDGKGKRFSGYNKDFVSSDIDNILETCSFSPCGKMYDASLFIGQRFPEGMTYEDFAFIPLIINKAKQFAYCNRTLYHYYINMDSIIMSKRDMTDRNIIVAQHLLEQSELSSKQHILENFYIRRVLESMCYTLILHNEDKKLVVSLIDEAYAKYPNIKANKYIHHAQFIKRVYFRLLLKHRYYSVQTWIKIYRFFAEIAKKIIKKCQQFR